MLDGNLASLGVFLLVFAGIASAILVGRGDADTRRLEGRIRSIHDVASAPGNGLAKQTPRNIRRTTGGSPLARALEKIGRSRHIPKERRVPWPVVAAVGLAAAAGASYFGNKVVSATAAPAFGVAGAAFLVR